MLSSARYCLVCLLFLVWIATPFASRGGPINTLNQNAPDDFWPPQIEITGKLSPQLAQAVAQIEAGHYDEAIAMVTAVISGLPAEKTSSPAYEVLGVAQYLTGETDAAVSSLKQAIALNPAQSTALTRLGIIELAVNRPDEAKRFFQQALLIDPGDLLARHRLASVLQNQGDRRGAIAEYEQILKSNGRVPLADRTALASLYNSEHRYEEAIGVLAPAVGANSHDPAALVVLGSAYLGVGDADTAAPLPAAAQALEPKNASTVLALGVAQRVSGQLDTALENIKRAVTARPDWVAAYYQLALTYIAQSKYQDAHDALAKAQQLDPQAREIRGKLGETLLLSGKPDEAIAAFEALTRRDDARLADYVALATAYQAEDRSAEAENVYRATVARFPKDPEAYWRLGAMLAYERKYDQARQVLAKGEAIAPKDPRLLRDAALVEARLGNYRKAISLAERLAELTPKDADSRFLAATLYQDSGDKERAIKLYEAIIADHPDNPWALNNLAAALTDRGDAATAIPIAQHAAKVLPDNAAIMDTLGWSLLKGGKASEAVAVLGKARVLSPANPETLYRLALAQQSMGNSEGARLSAEQALALSSDFKDVEGAKALLAGLPSEPSAPAKTP